MPSTYALLTDLRTYLGISGTTDDGLLMQCLERATVAIDTYTGRTFAASSATARKFDAETDVEGAVLYLDSDLYSVTSITNGDATTVTAAQYVTLPRRQPPYFAIELLPSTGLSWTYTTDHQNAITVTGYWCYSLVPPADVVHACIRWAGQLYKSKDAQVYDTFMPELGVMTVPQGVPKDVTLLLAPYRRRLG
jgi:hypothetical protein